jgi:hypothetical protein
MLDRGIFRTEATIEHQQNLIEKLRTHYPSITNESDLQRFANKEFDFGSIALTNSPLLSKALYVALERSRDPNDKAYCDHAAESHKAFQEVIQSLQDEIPEGNVTFRLQPITIKYTTTAGESEAITRRLIIEGEKRNRPSFKAGHISFRSK